MTDIKFFRHLSPEVIEEILKWLEGADILALAAASETIRGLVEARFGKYQSLLNGFFNCRRQNKQGIILQRRVTTSRIIFTSTPDDKMAALLQIVEVAREDAVERSFATTRLLIIVSSASEAEVTAKQVTAAGVECQAISGYPTRSFRERYWFDKKQFTQPGLIAVIVTHSRGEWEVWPDHVIAVNPPKSLKEHIQVEMIGGRTTWTLFTTSKESINSASGLTRFLQQSQPNNEGPDMAGPRSVQAFYDLPIWDWLTSNRVALVRKAYASKGRMSAQNWAKAV